MPSPAAPGRQPRPRTRRDFLRQVGEAGGAGALLSTMGALGLTACAEPAPAFVPPRPGDFGLTGRSAASVLILGAGVSGLGAAYELGKAGYSCTLLEARDRTGGRNFTVRGGTEHTELGGAHQRAAFADGQYLNAGPARIASWMVTLDYCRELGVPVEVFGNVNADAYIYRERNGMRPGQPVRRRAARADVFGHISELLAKATDQGALDAHLNAEDRDRLLGLLRDWGRIGAKSDDPARTRDYAGGPDRGYTQWPGAAGTPGVLAGPVPSLSEVLASGVGRELDFETGYEQSMTMLQPVGGMDAIPAALTRAVGPGRIELGAMVTGITDGPDRVAVTYRDADGRPRRREADYCISTLPPHLFARIPHDLGPDVQRAASTFVPVAAGKIGLEYRRRWWETDDRIYGGITETDTDLAHIWYPSHGFHDRRGVVVGYYGTGDRAGGYAELPHPAREARAVEQGVRVHGPRFRDELAGSFSLAWARAPHSEGGWQDVPGGPENPVYTPLLRPAGRVWFAGDWLSHTPSWQHGAFSSMRLAVTALHQRALSR